MITNVKNSNDLLEAFNENFNALLTGKRKIQLAKEVNNTLGKMSAEVRSKLLYHNILGDKQRINWYEEPIQIEMKHTKKLKRAV